MNVIFNQLEKIIDQYVLTEKVFVVPSHRDGKLAIQGLAKRGNAVLNVKVVTFNDLASELVQSELNKRKLSLLPNEIGKQFVYEALKQLKKAQSLSYFNDVHFTPSFCQAFYQAILDLKQVKVGLENFPEKAFLNKEKGQDIENVFRLYEEQRKQTSFIDSADLFRLACQVEPKETRNKVYVFFPHEAYYLTEKEFFLHYTKNTLVIPLGLPEVDGLESLPKMLEVEEEKETTHPLRHIFNVEKAIEEGLASFSLTAKISEDEEIQSVFRELKRNQIPFDQTVLFYTNQRPYVESLLRLQQKLGIPITFSEGIPNDLTKPGKLLKGIFRWVRDDFSVTALTKILREDTFDKEALPLSKERMIKLLKDSEVRWGKERYLQKVTERLELLIERQKQDGLDLEERIKEYKQLKKWLEKFLSLIPASKTWEILSYKTWLGNIRDLISTYASEGRSVNPSEKQSFDRMAKDEMLKTIEGILEATNQELTLNEAMAFTEQWLLSIPVGARNPLPGHIHVSPYRTGLYVDRSNVFIVGMDNGKFPGRVKEDPLLLDRERRLIHEEMTLGKAYVKRNIYLFVQMLLTTKENLHLSYPFMDTVESRTSSPAHLFLQLYRIWTKNPESTGEDLIEHLQEDVHFIQKTVSSMLHPYEWFAKQIWNGKRLDPALLQEASYENIIQAFIARAARHNEQITEYDGLVEYEGNLLDPRENGSMLSTSKLELLGTCPYSYFLRHVLHVEEEEEEEFDRYSWLDAMTRGSILHEVFEKFYLTLKEKNEKPSVDAHLTLIMNICDEILLEKREYLLPPSEMVYELERQEMLESCGLFLKAEEEASVDGEPLFFEYTFGMEGKEPAIVDLSDGKQLKLRGKIDRVDKLNDGTYSIIDYKTGSSYGFGEKNYFNGGRKLQHLLYALAFEKMLESEDGRVSSSVYVFPTLKGQGERAYRKHTTERVESFLQIVDHLCNYLKEGHFPYTDKEDDCKFCSYKIVCSRHTYSEDVLLKKAQDEKATGWKTLGEVRRHD